MSAGERGAFVPLSRDERFPNGHGPLRVIMREGKLVEGATLPPLAPAPLEYDRREISGAKKY